MNEKLNEIIEKLRSEFGKNFKQDDSHTWLIEVFTEAGRSQVVTLIYKEQYHSKENTSRLVAFSPIGPIFRDFNFEQMLRKNSELDIGAIAIEDLRNQDNIKVSYLVFRASHLFITLDYPEAWELVVKTGEYADKLENII